MYSIKNFPLGIYEKAIADSFCLKDKLSIAGDAGYDYLELSIDESDGRLARLDWSDAEIEDLKLAIKQTGVCIPTMCLSGHRRFPFGSKDNECRNKAFEIMEKAIILAYKLGIRCIQLATYDVYYEDSDDITKELFLDGIKKAVTMASRAGVILAMEIMDTPFVGTILNAMNYINKVNSPYFQIYPDMGNLTQFTSDIENELELGIGHIVAMHIKDTKPGVFKCVPFGEGSVNFDKVFNKLSKLGYSGLFMIEMWADNSINYSREDAAAYIIEAKKFVESKMSNAGYIRG